MHLDAVLVVVRLGIHVAELACHPEFLDRWMTLSPPGRNAVIAGTYSGYPAADRLWASRTTCIATARIHRGRNGGRVRGRTRAY